MTTRNEEAGLKVLITRPRVQAERTAARLRTLGHVAIVSPLLEIVPVSWAAPLHLPDLILVTSANAVLNPIPAKVLDVPVLAMGEASAAAARIAGFGQVEAHAAKGADALYRAAVRRSPQRALHLCGRDLVTHDVPSALPLDRIITYQADLRSLTKEAALALCDGGIDITLLYSGRTARQFAHEIDRLGAARARQHIALLGAFPGNGIGKGWQSAVRATEPNEDALFAAANLLRDRGQQA